MAQAQPLDPALAVWQRAATDPVYFVERIIGATPDPWQAETLEALGRGNVAVRSGHGPGKTTLASWALLWGVAARLATVPCTAPTQHQLYDLLWSEAKRWIRRSPSLSDVLDVTATQIKVRGVEWAFAAARVARSPEGLAGWHAEELLYIVDEASGIPDETMAVVDGALTTEGARCLMVGNPTRVTGYFVDAFGRNRARWWTATINSEESPRVSARWVADMASTWGRDSDVYRVRVLGLPPMGEGRGFFPPHLVQEAVDRLLQALGDGPLTMGVDVARYGEDNSCILGRRGYRVNRLNSRHGLGNPEVAAWVADVIDEDRLSLNERVTVRVDDGGVGGGVTDLLSVMVMEGTLINVDVVPMNFGGRGNRWYHTNAGMWAHDVRRLMQEGLLGLPDDSELIQQLITRTSSVNIKGKIVLEPKDHIKSRGLPSPDKADALLLAFAFEDPGGGWGQVYGLVECACGRMYPSDSHDRCPVCGVAKPNDRQEPDERQDTG